MQYSNLWAIFKNRCRAAQSHERVANWTKSVDLFAKDYIFIPVHDSLHWSLCIVCHPGNVGPYNPAAQHEAYCGWGSGKQREHGDPCILHLDSMTSGHRVSKLDCQLAI